MLKRKEFILGAAVGLTFAAAATAGGIIDWPAAGAQAQRAEMRGGLVPASTAGAVLFQPPPGAPNSFADIIEQVSPAVVQIDVTTRVPRPTMRGFPNIPGLPFPFSVPQQPQGEDGEEPMMEGAGSGSGFFISADGFIVTNNHVVANASEITVRLTDDRELTARVVGRDELTDLAVLKVDGGTFPFVQFETQAQPRVGDWVVALGNPFGLGGSATAGIVSARGRDLRDQTSAYIDYLQIDAPINRGNSGGPTFDIYGRVIGVNTAIFSPTGVSVGIGFAIPADVAHRVTQELMQGGNVERGWLGVSIGTLTPDMREALGLGEDVTGAYVNDVTPGAPAEAAGLRAEDVITELNGEAIRNNTDLTRRVGQARAGETLRVTVLREGRRVQLNVRAGVRPSEDQLTNPSSPEQNGAPERPSPAGVVVEGLRVAPMSAALRQQYGIDPQVNGLVILGVEAGTKAARIPFEPGMVIQSADRRAVTTVDELRAAVQRLREAGRPSILLFVRTRQGNTPVVLELDGDEE